MDNNSSSSKKPIGSTSTAAQQCAKSSETSSSSSLRARNSDSSGGKPKSSARRRDPTNATNTLCEQQQPSYANNGNGRNGRRGGGGNGGGGSGGHGGGATGRGGPNNGGRGAQRQHRHSVSSSTTSGSGLDGDPDGGFFVAELNSVYAPGSKKQNLNHLLNFKFGPLPSLQRGGGHHHQQQHHHHNHHQQQRYNKEQFVLANCHQFVVRADVPLLDALVAGGGSDLAADKLVDWSLVEQVHVRATEEPQCPICLHYPAAAKMTRCGHVYCWPCVLHYLALSDHPWRKCPICYDAVHAADLRSCVARRCAAYAVGDVVQLQLMRRAKGSLQVTQMSMTAAAAGGSCNDSPVPHLFDDALGNGRGSHSKLLLANCAEVLSIVERERTELMQRRDDDGEQCPETMFIEQALELLRQRGDAVLATMDKQRRNNNDVGNRSVAMAAPIVEPDASVTDALQSLSLADVAVVESPANFVIDATESALTLHDLQITPSAPDAEHFYFYQAADAQLLYMHSVNTRMLQAQWTELRHAPPLISGRILQKESCSMTEALRKRLKYLQHLPIGSQFEVVEIGLGDDVVGDVVQEMFQEELVSRQRMRQRRAKEERKREKHIDEVNDRQIGKIPRGRTPNIDMMSTQHFPIYTDRDLSPTHFDVATFDGPPLVVVESSATHAQAAGGRRRKQRDSAADGSFAKMLTAPQQANELWPTLGPVKVSAADFPDTLHAAARSGPVAAAQSSVVQHGEHDDCDDDDYGLAAGGMVYEDELLAAGGGAAPAFAPDYGSAIAQALGQKEMFDWVAARSGAQGASKNDAHGGGCTSSGGGKKKKRNKILFTTNVRSYNGN